MKGFLMLFSLLGTLTSVTSAGTPGEVKVGSYLRETTLHGFDGKTRALSKYKGKPLLINVWASWCGPCRAEMDSLERLAARYNGKEFNRIGISTDDNNFTATAFIQQSGITFDNFHDRKLLLENMLGANTIPLTILVDEKGQVLTKVRGAQEWDSPRIVAAIKKIFQLKPEPDPMFGLHMLNLN